MEKIVNLIKKYEALFEKMLWKTLQTFYKLLIVYERFIKFKSKQRLCTCMMCTI